MIITIIITFIHLNCRHVNKKALDQYMNFADQREELAQRQRENARGDEKIKQLIRTLDMKKDEAIERTFKARAFAQYYNVLQFLSNSSISAVQDSQIFNKSSSEDT